jgi:hypothetical protein
LIDTATVRRPQLGVSESEKKQLLDSYRALKEIGYRSAANLSAARSSGTAR